MKPFMSHRRRLRQLKLGSPIAHHPAIKRSLWAGDSKCAVLDRRWRRSNKDFSHRSDDVGVLIGLGEKQAAIGDICYLDHSVARGNPNRRPTTGNEAR